MQIEYCIDNTFMVRTPVLDLEVLDEISAEKTLTDLLRSFYSRDIILEALFLASPQLYHMAMGWMEHNEQNKKLEATLMKYLIRMSSRCTPFGLFAGISSGTFGETSNMMPSTPEQHELSIRYDYQIICKLIDQVANDHRSGDELKFFPNSSLYRIGDEYRYIEYYNGNDGIRHYKLQSTSYTSELETVMQSASIGVSTTDLVNILVDAGISRNNASQYINALIDNQVLVSGIEPIVNGNSCKNWLLDCVQGMDRLGDMMIEKQNRIGKTQFHQHRERITMYEEVITDLRSCEFPFEENALFQADLKIELNSTELGPNIKEDLLDVLTALMKFSRPGYNPVMDTFKERFLRRFEEREVPLMLALDDEAGPGYASTESLPGDSDLLNELRIPGRPDLTGKLVFSKIDKYLYRQLTDTLALGSYELDINPEEIIDLPDPVHSFPATMAIMARLLDKCDEGQRMQIISAGGVSALNLAGRFCQLDAKLEEAIRRMAQKEKELAGEQLLAEILHLPQQRTGNILFRPAFYDYEIPFLARSEKPPDFQIPVSDLLVSIENNKILLRSEGLGNFIIPRLSNAHNYAHGSLPLYQFLCDLQSQDICTSLGFSWGPLERETTFLPRVKYRTFILSPASWNLQKRHFGTYLAMRRTDNRREALEKLRFAYRIPRYVLLCEADNELWLDLQHPDCLELLFQELHVKEQVHLKEYFNGSIVSGKHGKFANEFIFFLYRKQ